MRVSKFLCWFLLSVVSLVLPATAQTAADRKDIADVRTKLSRELEQLRAQNYEHVDESDIELIERGKTESFLFQLKANTTYALVAACDPECTHVAISLMDSRGQLLVQSPERHHTVIISGTPQESGEYTAELSVPGCAEGECYAGLLLLSLRTSLRQGHGAPSRGGAWR